MDQLKKHLEELHIKRPDNSIELLFVQKTDRKAQYIAHRPSVSTEVQNEIWAIIFPNVKSILEENILVIYQPEGCLDGQIEQIETTEIPMFEKFIERISEDSLNEELNSLKIENIDFYCIRVTFSEKEIIFFRRFAKQRKLRKGFITRITNNVLNTIEKDFLNFDDMVDCIVFEGTLYLLNHIALERIFKYRDAFIKKTEEAIQLLLEKDIIINCEEFSKDCAADIRVMKKFTSIMKNDKLPLFFQHYDKVPVIVSSLELDINFDEKGKLLYRDKSQLPHILQLMADSYFQSLLTNRQGVVLLEKMVKEEV